MAAHTFCHSGGGVGQGVRLPTAADWLSVAAIYIRSGGVRRSGIARAAKAFGLRVVAFKRDPQLLLDSVDELSSDLPTVVSGPSRPRNFLARPD
jgi:hypothetical protein